MNIFNAQISYGFSVKTTKNKRGRKDINVHTYLY